MRELTNAAEAFDPRAVLLQAPYLSQSGAPRADATGRMVERVDDALPEVA